MSTGMETRDMQDNAAVPLCVLIQNIQKLWTKIVDNCKSE